MLREKVSGLAKLPPEAGARKSPVGGFSSTTELARQETTTEFRRALLRKEVCCGVGYGPLCHWLDVSFEEPKNGRVVR